MLNIQSDSITIEKQKHELEHTNEYIYIYRLISRVWYLTGIKIKVNKGHVSINNFN